jgi:hypothetical protein
LLNEPKLLKKPVRVEPKTDQDRLLPESRVNYAKVYTIEHNLRVWFIGRIHDQSKAIFFTEVRRLFNCSDEEEGNPEELPQP